MWKCEKKGDKYISALELERAVSAVNVSLSADNDFLSGLWCELTFLAFGFASSDFTVVRRNRFPFVHIPASIIAFHCAGQLDSSILSDERHFVNRSFLAAAWRCTDAAQLDKAVCVSVRMQLGLIRTKFQWCPGELLGSDVTGTCFDVMCCRWRHPSLQQKAHRVISEGGRCWCIGTNAGVLGTRCLREELWRNLLRHQRWRSITKAQLVKGLWNEPVHGSRVLFSVDSVTQPTIATTTQTFFRAMVICFRYDPCLYVSSSTFSFPRCRDVTRKLRPACLTLRCFRNAESGLAGGRRRCEHMRTASAHAAQRPVHASLVIHNPDSRPTKHKRHEDTHIITPAPQTAWDILKGKWEGLHNPKLWSKVEDEAHTGNATRRAHAPEPYKAATYLSGLAGKARTEKKSTLCIPERERMRRSSFRPVVVRFYCLVLVKLCEQVYLHEEKKKDGDNVLRAAEAALFPPISPYCDSAYAKRLL